MAAWWTGRSRTLPAADCDARSDPSQGCKSASASGACFSWRSCRPGVPVVSGENISSEEISFWASNCIIQGYLCTGGEWSLLLPQEEPVGSEMRRRMSVYSFQMVQRFRLNRFSSINHSYFSNRIQGANLEERESNRLGPRLLAMLLLWLQHQRQQDVFVVDLLLVYYSHLDAILRIRRKGSCRWWEI